MEELIKEEIYSDKESLQHKVKRMNKFQRIKKHFLNKLKSITQYKDGSFALSKDDVKFINSIKKMYMLYPYDKVSKDLIKKACLKYPYEVKEEDVQKLDLPVIYTAHLSYLMDSLYPDSYSTYKENAYNFLKSHKAVFLWFIEKIIEQE